MEDKVRYKDINAYILAGGKSSRMQMDKAFIRIGDKYFIDVIIEKLSTVFENIYLVGKIYSHPFLKQSIPDLVEGKGPIGGILTALTHSEKNINFFIGLDYPLLDSRIIEILLEISEKDNFNCLAYVPKLEDGIHPLFAIYRREIINKVKECISKNRYQVRCIYNNTKTKYINLIIKAIEYSDNLTKEDIKRCFYNLNTPEDYKALFDMYQI